MHRTCFLKTTDIFETMKTRKDIFDVNNLSRDQLRIINASLQSDCVMIVCSRCKGNSNIRKLLNKLSSVVTKTAVKLDQYEEKLKEMETKLDDVKERIVEVEKVKPTQAAWVKEEVKKRHSLQVVELSQQTRTAVQIVSNPTAPSNGGPIYRFLGMPAMRTRWMAGAAAHKSG